MFSIGRIVLICLLAAFLSISLFTATGCSNFPNDLPGGGGGGGGVTGGGGGGGATPTPTPTATPTPTPTPVFSVSPNPALVTIGTTKTFTSIFNGTGPAPGVAWFVNGVQGGAPTTGTISLTGATAVYTAPTTFPGVGNNSILITAQGPPFTANANVTLVYPLNNSLSQTFPIKLGTSGGNGTDISGSFCCSGTLGSLIQRGGVQYILSNNHVLDKSDHGTVGQAITQPGLIDTTPGCFGPTATVANLSQAVPVTPTVFGCGVSCGCPATSPVQCGASPHNVDAAIAQVFPGNVDATGSILDLGAATSTTIAAAPPSATVAVPAIGMGVAKSGRTTGLTCSSILTVNTNISIDYVASCNAATPAFIATYTNQVVINSVLSGNLEFSAAGDSGSLIVSSNNSRPVALLYGGNATTTVANPIQDVITQLTVGGQIPSFVGGADHAVSCLPTNATAPNPADLRIPSASEFQRLTAIKAKYSADLMSRHPEITSVEIGTSVDDSRASALLLNANSPLQEAVPNQIEGVRTRVVYSGQQSPQLASEEIASATAAKEANVSSWLGQFGIYGVGVGQSLDAPQQAALILFVETKQAQTLNLPAEIDGVRTRLIVGERFSASRWGREAKITPACSSRKPAASKKN